MSILKFLDYLNNPRPNRKIKKILIGAINFRHITKIGNVLTPMRPWLVNVSLSWDRLNTHPAKKEISIPPSGNKMFEEVKSKNEKKLRLHNPKNSLLLKYPKDKI